jgi:hypothetical protein
MAVKTASQRACLHKAESVFDIGNGGLCVITSA